MLPLVTSELICTSIKLVYDNCYARFELLCLAVTCDVEVEVIADQQVLGGLLRFVAESALALFCQVVLLQVAPKRSGLG